MWQRLEVNTTIQWLLVCWCLQGASDRQQQASTGSHLTGCSSLNVMCNLRTCSVYRCGILASKLQQHGIIKELIDGYVFTHTLQCNSCHDCTAYKQVLYCYICDCACF